MADLSPSRLCTAEEVMVAAWGDFPLLVPPNQVLARGYDGAFTGDSWVLLSSLTNFGTRGVASGDPVILAGDRGSAAAAEFGDGTPLVVDTVSGYSLTLRRVQMGSGVGEPAGTPSSMTGVEFIVASIAQQIGLASNMVKARIGTTDEDGDYATEFVSTLAVHMTLYYLYTAASRQAGNPAQADVFWGKAQEYKKLFDELLESVIGDQDGGGSSVTAGWDDYNAVPID